MPLHSVKCVVATATKPDVPHQEGKEEKTPGAQRLRRSSGAARTEVVEEVRRCG